MRTAALITAAGLSSRMGDFKPMMNIGNISIAQRIVATFQQSGVDMIVMVTGYNATALERHLANNNIIFLRNENYEHTQMFDSCKIGLEYLADKCDQVLFTPVDIPLFTASTVRKLMYSDSALACPCCEGEAGHPLLLSSRVIYGILNDVGDGGLQGAIQRLGVPLERIEVTDKGILHDADTREDYDALLKFHNNQLIRPVVDVSLSREKIFLNSKISTLLRLIDETSSVRAACQRLQISYSAGWALIRTLESQTEYPMLERTQGGAGGGQSHLTEEGRRLLFLFDLYEEAVREQVNILYKSYFEYVF